MPAEDFTLFHIGRREATASPSVGPICDAKSISLSRAGGLTFISLRPDLTDGASDSQPGVVKQSSVCVAKKKWAWR